VTAVAFVLVFLGAVLLWSAIKGRDPRELVRDTLRPSGG
jgi:hypothetical protein